MKISIKLNCNDASFNSGFYNDIGKAESCDTEEICRILRKLADRIDGASVDSRDDSIRLFDINGNHCGEVSFGKGSFNIK